MYERGRGRGPPYPPPDRDSFGRMPRHPGPPPPRHGGYREDRRYDDRRGPPPPPDRYRRGGPPPGRPRKRGPNVVTFRSYEEEMDWVEDRRRKRQIRESKFDKEPTPEQMAQDAAALAFSNPAATDFAGIPSDRNFSDVPQQTRHARRLYIGNLPPNVSEQELHVFFRDAIAQALVSPQPDGEDPILSVYINHERRFCFLEFRTVEMATAGLVLDGIDINGRGKVKIKRPNDYNPAMAPKVSPHTIPVLDPSRLGIISGTVQDGPNKVFVGGLHYHLTEDQVLELLQAFGKVKAFHLVKNEMDSTTSKGYCFVEYVDPNVTQVAVMGMNGMDLGGGKVLTARVAGERSGLAPSYPEEIPQGSEPPPNAIIIDGYDVEALVDAAMGLRPMPVAPMYVDKFGVPMNRAVPVLPSASNGGASNGPLPPGASPLDIATAALDAAFGGTENSSQLAKSRILVLCNMVTDEDIATDRDYNALVEEVREECLKFGKLLAIQIPREATDKVAASAIKKVFLEYATVEDAVTANTQLEGRQFGPNVVETSFFSEADYSNGVLR